MPSGTYNDSGLRLVLILLVLCFFLAAGIAAFLINDAASTGYMFGQKIDFEWLTKPIDLQPHASASSGTGQASTAAKPDQTSVQPRNSASSSGAKQAAANPSVAVMDMQNMTRLVWDNGGKNYSLYDNDLVLMMNFDQLADLGEGSDKVADLSRYGNDGKVSGGEYTDGRYGGGLGLQDGYVEVPDSPTFNADKITISFWTKLDDVNSYNTGVIRDSGYDGRRYVGIFPTYDKPMVHAFVSTDESTATVDGKTALRSEKWHHIAMTYDGKNLSIYLDGELDGQVPLSGKMKKGNEPYIIGKQLYQGTWYYPLRGVFDELRIYNRSFDADEVKQLYSTAIYKYEPDKWAFYADPNEPCDSCFWCAVDATGNKNCTNEFQKQTSMPSVSASGPDLVITSVNVQPEKPKYAEPIVVTVVVKNIGDAGTKSGFLVYMKADCIGNGEFFYKMKPLAKGENTTVAFGSETPIWAKDYAVRESCTGKIIADEQQEVQESDESNNEQSFNIQMEGSGENKTMYNVSYPLPEIDRSNPDLPDLFVVGAVVEPDRPKPDDPMKITILIGNNGSKDVTQPFWVDVSTDTILNGGLATRAPGIKRGEVLPVVFENWVNPSEHTFLKSGEVNVLVDYTNDGGQIDELNEENNGYSFNITAAS